MQSQKPHSAAAGRLIWNGANESRRNKTDRSIQNEAATGSIRPTIRRDLAEKSQHSCHLSPGSLCVSHAIPHSATLPLPRQTPLPGTADKYINMESTVSEGENTDGVTNQELSVTRMLLAAWVIERVCVCVWLYVCSGVCVCVCLEGRGDTEMPRRPSPSNCASRFTSPTAPAAIFRLTEPPTLHQTLRCTFMCVCTHVQPPSRVVRSYFSNILTYVLLSIYDTHCR